MNKRDRPPWGPHPVRDWVLREGCWDGVQDYRALA